ncbi:DUF3788 domain-containing protein [Clostridium prolinivorans]|uniref:DUF3788 domain-containing protein n=1 Tax=Clostridium prolinivorans TaxID=2769420 RepID=UPI000FD798E0|nr:DUF3788 domain-containing protein [Clostridium prolinivorans]
MLEVIPTNQDLKELLGEEKFNVWTGLANLVEDLYSMETVWYKGYRDWKYELKYRKSGKTLCSLNAKENCVGLMIIFGKAEREKFENECQSYAPEIQCVYNNSTTHYDGKWMMFELADLSLIEDIRRLLYIKKRPNKKKDK